jgi:hypothetical protein
MTGKAMHAASGLRRTAARVMCAASLWVIVVFGAASPKILAQKAAAEGSAPPAVTLTDAQDQENMMTQLGIRALRPGPSGDERAPNHANYDEDKANPFPEIPKTLVLNNGERVTTADVWQKHRAEIIEGFDCCVYRRVPKNVPKVTWSVRRVDREYIGFRGCPEHPPLTDKGNDVTSLEKMKQLVCNRWTGRFGSKLRKVRE